MVHVHSQETAIPIAPTAFGNGSITTANISADISTRIVDLPREILNDIFYEFIFDPSTLFALSLSNKLLNGVVAPLIDRYSVRVTTDWPTPSATPDRVTPIHWAAYHGKINILRDLLSRINVCINLKLPWPEPHTRSNNRPYPLTPLVYAVLGGHPDAATLLIKMASPSVSGSEQAVKFETPETSYSNRLELDRITPLYIAVMLRNREMVDTLLRDMIGKDNAVAVEQDRSLHGRNDWEYHFGGTNMYSTKRMVEQVDGKQFYWRLFSY